VPPDERAREIELQPDDVRPIPLELRLGRVSLAQRLALVYEAPNLGLEAFDVWSVLPHRDAHTWMYRHESRGRLGVG
jgi:hypothetical protein